MSEAVGGEIPIGVSVRIPPDLLGEEKEADLIEWLHPDGALIEQGAALADLSTAKVVVQVEAPISGRIHHLVASGALVTPDTVIAIISS
jgi:pyruvate/2-oxoglutarate dehydrogenase complex dihydrolipoamide acyltransferase (E2) component